MKKYKLTTNLPLKIIAFVFAAFLWLIVANVANPVTKSTYTNIKVTIANRLSRMILWLLRILKKWIPGQG